MKAIYIDNYGPLSEVVHTGEFPIPDVGPRDILVEMHAASVNPIDHLIVKGYMRGVRQLRMPALVGNDVAGTVVRTGAAVARFQVGDAVFSRVDPARAGTFAEYVAVDESLAAHMPTTLSFEQAAAVPLVSLTAWQALTERSSVTAGDKVLIHAGSGGVGSAAIQLATHLGAHVATTVQGASMDRARKLGAEWPIDYRTERFEDVVGDCDMVLDTLGGETQARSYQVLKPGGTLVSVVAVPDAEANAARYGVKVEPFFMRPDGTQLEELAAIIDAGKLKPTLDRSFPLAEAVQALLYSESRQANGKVIITVK